MRRLCCTVAFAIMMAVPLTAIGYCLFRLGQISPWAPVWLVGGGTAFIGGMLFCAAKWDRVS